MACFSIFNNRKMVLLQNATYRYMHHAKVLNEDEKPLRKLEAKNPLQPN